MKRVIITGAIIGLFLIVGTLIAVMYARGYRINPENGTKLEGTGLLVLTSKPDGAKVLINDKITTATNNTINLYPGEYDVKIIKEGYFPWHKKISLKKEIVSRADALLLPTAPKLESITITGAQNPIVDPTQALIAYTVSSASAENNGIYVLDMNARPILNLGGAATQIISDSQDSFSQANVEFTPDSNQLIASISSQIQTSSYLLSAKGFNSTPQNISLTLPQHQLTWDKQKTQKENELLKSQRKQLIKVITDNFKNYRFSAERDKILYEASNSAEIPIIIKPRLIGTNSTPEERKIVASNIYVYDIKEDRNYLIYKRSSLKKDEEMPKFIWHPDSNHLIFAKDKKINIVEFDGINLTTVWGGPFVENFVLPWPDGSGLVILTNFNNDSAPYNLYKLILK